MELLCIGDVVDSSWGLGEPDVVLGSRKLLVNALGAAGPLFQGLMIYDTWHFQCIFSTVTYIQTINLYSTAIL